MSSFRDTFRRLRRTLSLKRRKSHSKKSHSNQNWENDSVTIGQGGLSFPVKYLGWLEVSESRGTQVCSQAAHQMKMSAAGKKKQRVTLWVTEDTLRVIDDETKSLVVDQVIEKVSFCTPDPHDEMLFSYICRDGTSRRWLCHSFRGIKDSGERISHAVGCAFAACLQKKQQQNQQNQNFQRGNTTRKTLEKRQNGVVLPQESVQIIQQINQEEHEQRMQKALEKHAPAVPSAFKDPSDTPAPISPTTKAAAPTFARPRPSAGVDAASFTRHMSLKYRSKGSSSGSATYQALTEDPLPPRIPYSPEGASEVSAVTSVLGGHDPAEPVSNANMWSSNAVGGDQRRGHDLILTPTQPNPFSSQHAASAQPVNKYQQAGWTPGMIQPPAEQKPNPFAQGGWGAHAVNANANPFGERFV